MRAPIRALALLAVSAFVAGCGIPDPYHGDEQVTDRPDHPLTTAGSPGAGEEGIDVLENYGNDLVEQSSGGTLDATDDVAVPVDEPAPVVAEPGSRGGESPREVVSRYARAFSNWTWRDVARRNAKVLARLTAGQLRDSVRANAADMRADTTLERDRPANRGEQVAIDVQGSDPRRRTVWVVLRETASQQGMAALADTRITVYRAAAELGDDGRWYVTAFEPQG